MKPAIALVALDIDGTLLTPSHQVTPATRVAIQEAREAGLALVLASSRGPVGIRRVQRELDHLDGWLVAFQGALVGRWRQPPGTLATVADHRIPEPIADHIMDLAVGSGLSASRQAGMRWSAPVIDDAIARSAAITGETPVAEPCGKGHDSEPPHKIMVIAGKDALLPALARFYGDLPAGVTAAYSHHNYVEITAADVTKGTGVAKVAETLGIPLHNCAAIGDGANDLAMLAAVGLPIAMGQAGAQVRGAARWTTDTNTHDGAAKALQKLLRFREDTS